MKNFTEAVREFNEEKRLRRVTNFMGGNSYELNPIDTLRIVTASSIFGEPAYYRNGEFADATLVKDGFFKPAIESFLNDFNGMKTSDIMIKVIREALYYDFAATLDWAVTLRTEFLMRLNPQVIMVEAATHPCRAQFTKNSIPGAFDAINQIVMSRADEPAAQLTYYLYKNKGNKNNVPNILKRSWANKLSRLSPYQVAKYKNSHIGMIDTVRVSHANSKVINELMKTGNVNLPESEKTWENLKSEGKTWKEILATIDIGHMALLRNLRNIFSEDLSYDEAKKVLNDLVAGVKDGKQFPFRYWSAYNAIKLSGVNHMTLVLDALEGCMDESLNSMPKLHGKTMCLSDNSGSAWGTFNSEFGSVTIAEIGNLSSIITAKNSDEGSVGLFGDKLKTFEISKRSGILSDLADMRKARSSIGGGTENGIWLFFRDAINKKEHWDNIFIYSDMQAGHGGLYGLNYLDYRDYRTNGSYIDVLKLVKEYRQKSKS